MPSGSPSSGHITAAEGGDVFAGSGLDTAFGSISLTETADTFAGLAPITAGMLTVTELADTAAMVGWCIVGSTAVTAGSDSFAGTGGFLAAGSISGSGGTDSMAGAGAFLAAGSIAITAGDDAASIAGMLTSVGSFAITEGADGFSGTAAPADAGSFSITAGSDSAALVGGFLAAGSAAVTEGGDSPAFTGFYGELGTIGPTEGADSPALVGLFMAAAAMAVAEGHDTFASTPGLAVTAVMAATERGDSFAAFSSGLEYQIYSNTGIGDPINYGLPIATTGLLTWTSGPLVFPGTWKFGVRAFDPVTGLEEENLDAAITLILDGSGIDITNRPKAPMALRAFPTAGGGIRVEWAYNTINPNPAPTGFHVYKGTGGSPSYGSPAATVSFQAAIAGTFVANLAGLSNGVAYTIGVRAYNATAEEPNTVTVTVTADSTGPSAVVSLTATAII